MPRRDGASPDERVATLTEDEVKALEAEEAEKLAAKRAERVKAAAERAAQAAEGVTDLSDEELAGELDELYADRTTLEEQRVKVRGEQIANADRIAALEQEQHDRRKAGFLTAELG